MRKLTVTTAVVALAAVASLAGTASASTSAVRLCNTKVYGANGPEVYVTSARNLTCRAAAREQRRYKWTGKNRFTTPGGYVCRPSGRGSVGYQIRCVHTSETQATKVYRIEFVD